MESFKAVPTEYRGIRYKSKSEAMFARWLELEGSNLTPGYSGSIHASGFQYEPQSMVVENWVFDFLQWNTATVDGARSGSVPVMYYTLIEYKPNKPTKTYLSVLARRFDRLKENFKWLGNMEFFCFYGSLFNEERNRLQYVNRSWYDSEDWMEDWHKSEIMNTRFDLERSA